MRGVAGVSTPAPDARVCRLRSGLRLAIGEESGVAGAAPVERFTGIAVCLSSSGVPSGSCVESGVCPPLARWFPHPRAPSASPTLWTMCCWRSGFPSLGGSHLDMRDARRSSASSAACWRVRGCAMRGAGSPGGRRPGGGASGDLTDRHPLGRDAARCAEPGGNSGSRILGRSPLDWFQPPSGRGNPASDDTAATSMCSPVCARSPRPSHRLCVSSAPACPSPASCSDAR